MANNITTYKEAKDLMALLQEHHVKIMPETLSMKTSGIYIPATDPHSWDGSTAKWFFFYRFCNEHPDLNVGHLHRMIQEHGIHKVAKEINEHR